MGTHPIVLLRQRSRSAPGSRFHLIALVLGWPMGLAKVTWRYTWRTTPIHRVETEGDASDLPPPLSPEVLDDAVQPVADGFGALLHRRYWVTVDGADTEPEALISTFAGEPNKGTPTDIAVFVKTRGRPGVLAVGDEFLIRMPGPWNGPVRVIACGPASFRLATLRGHLEAGQIEFSARRADDGALHIEIESSARPGDRLSRVLYDVLRLAKEVQLNLWVETLMQLAARSGGRLRDGVHVRTRRVEDPAPLLEV